MNKSIALRRETAQARVRDRKLVAQGRHRRRRAGLADALDHRGLSGPLIFDKARRATFEGEDD
jgi:hypothetical protein